MVWLLSGDEDKFPTAKAGRDIVVQPNDTVTLNGIESWDDKVITSYKWSLVKGDSTVEITVRTSTVILTIITMLHIIIPEGK